MIGAISFGGGLMAAQVPELHAASPTKQGNPDQLAGFDASEGRLTPARPLGSLMVAGNVRVMSHAQETEQKSETSTASAEYIRKVTKRCRVTPKPGPRFCPEKRGPDYVPVGGWKKVGFKPGFNDWKDKNTMFWNEAKRKPVRSRNLPLGPLPDWLYFRVPYDPVYGFAPPREQILKHLIPARRYVLKSLSNCESGDRVDAVSPGGHYIGPYQFDSEGGYVDNHAPDVEQLYGYRGVPFNTRILKQGEYDLIAIRGIWYGRQGLGAFPHCGRGLG